MIWNWQQKDWPNFKYDRALLSNLEERFLYNSGIVLGAERHLSISDKKSLIVKIAGDEALSTSEIEGEYLNRDSLQSSIRNYFGFGIDNRRATPAELGISEMMVDLYNNYEHLLSHESLFKWQRMLMNGRTDLKDIGAYRTHKEPMQVISGKYYNPKVHFEAPPSSTVKKEMDRYIEWYNREIHITHEQPSALTIAGISHLYFECIHPFEDGNGRIGRAIVIKALSQSIGHPSLIALSHIINKKKKLYYDALECNNKNIDITDWLLYFAATVLEAQNYTLTSIEFLIKKAKFYDKFKYKLNARQEKVIQRIFEEGVEGFRGGLSADNYVSITSTSKATATRDLRDLIELKAFAKTGVLKGTRYYINFSES